jgi:transposase
MRRFVEGADRVQSTLFPECLEDWIGEDNPVRVIDVFVDELELAELGFDGVEPEVTGRPSYHPSALLKLYIYGDLNRVQSSRRLEREAGRNVEVMWLTGRLAPDPKTIADFRKDNGRAIRQVCARFVALCRTLGLLTQASVAIDGSDTVSGRLTRTGFLRRCEAVIFDSHESREASHGACSGSSEHRGIGGALPEVCGCVRGAALPDDLASGTGPYGGGSFRTDEFCAALDRGTSGPL